MRGQGAAGAAPGAEIGLEPGLSRQEIGIGHLRSRLEHARLDAGVVHSGDPTRIDERRWNRGVDIDEGVEIVVRHYLVKNALQVRDAQGLTVPLRPAKRFGPGSPRKSQ